MENYSYQRGHIADGRYAIDNPLRVDAEGKQIYLASEIEAAFPSHHFTINCNVEDMTISFEIALTSAEKAALDEIVRKHKANE